MAREGYLVGAGEDTIHTGVIELKTAKDKRKNWWFYHKAHLIIGIVATVMAASLIWSIVGKVDPDYSIALVTSYNVPSEVLSSMENHIARYADDRNGDGKVIINVNSYVFGDIATTTDLQAMQAVFARFTGDATLGTNMIYIHDSAGLSSVSDMLMGFFQYNDGSPMPDTAIDFENAMLPLSDYKAFTDFAAVGSELSNWTPEVVKELCARLRVSVRAKEGSSIEGDKKLEAYYDASLALLDRLKNDSPISADNADDANSAG